MKTNGAVWKAYLDSFPEEQWYDGAHELVNGMEPDGTDLEDDDQVSITGGVVYTITSSGDRINTNLISHFQKWLRIHDMLTIVVEIPKDRSVELKTFVKSINGRIR